MMASYKFTAKSDGKKKIGRISQSRVYMYILVKVKWPMDFFASPVQPVMTGDCDLYVNVFVRVF